MNWYRKFIIAEKVQSGDENFSWVRLDVPENIKKIHSKTTKEIDEKDLYKEEKVAGDWTHGIEDKPHLTVKYGLEFDEPDKVIDALKKEKGGTVQIKEVEIFDNENYDVLVVRCESKALDKIHSRLTRILNIEDKYPEYKPHITIAYFKKGRAKKYEDMVVETFITSKLSFDFNEVIFEDRKDKDTPIKLS
jgi:2'-5' RNA ligase